MCLAEILSKVDAKKHGILFHILHERIAGSDKKELNKGMI